MTSAINQPLFSYYHSFGKLKRESYSQSHRKTEQINIMIHSFRFQGFIPKKNERSEVRKDKYKVGRERE